LKNFSVSHDDFEDFLERYEAVAGSLNELLLAAYAKNEFLSGVAISAIRWAQMTMIDLGFSDDDISTVFYRCLKTAHNDIKNAVEEVDQ